MYNMPVGKGLGRAVSHYSDLHDAASARLLRTREALVGSREEAAGHCKVDAAADLNSAASAAALCRGVRGCSHTKQHRVRCALQHGPLRGAATTLIRDAQASLKWHWKR